MDADAPVEQSGDGADPTGLIRKWLVQSAFSTLALAAILFFSSGRLDWVMAWLYVGLYIGIVAINALINLSKGPELIAERSGIKEGVKTWDKVLAPLAAVHSLFAMWIVSGLDMRFGWSPEVPLALQIVALTVAALGALLTAWAMASNRFFSTFVRIQRERGHTVASGGPYRYVRHPGYAGAILHYLATPLVLASLWGLMISVVAALLFVLRTALEDRTLQAELGGYREYAQRVRYRLLPAIW